MTPIAPTLQAFFTDRLTRSSTRAEDDRCTATRCGCCFASRRSDRHAALGARQGRLDEALVAAFLAHLEEERGNGARTATCPDRDRSLFRFAALRHPEHAALIAPLLSIPPNARAARITFLSATRPGR